AAITAGGIAAPLIATNVKLAGNDKMNHVESVSLQYEKITWRIVDGNIQYTDSWNERPTA
ncbi:hypothetical protein O5281_26575, partial [Escherichia coli]|nr:hypothetical protein [Escherichia coli]